MPQISGVFHEDNCEEKLCIGWEVHLDGQTHLIINHHAEVTFMGIQMRVEARNGGHGLPQLQDGIRHSTWKH